MGDKNAFLNAINLLNKFKVSHENDNLQFKSFTRNDNFIIFTNEFGSEVIVETNKLFDDGNNNLSETSIDTSIFDNLKVKNSKVKKTFSDTSDANNSLLSKGKYSDTSVMSGGNKGVFSEVSEVINPAVKNGYSETSINNYENLNQTFSETSITQNSEQNNIFDKWETSMAGGGMTSDTLASITELNVRKSGNKVMAGGGLEREKTNVKKTYEINSSSTNSFCE